MSYAIFMLEAIVERTLIAVKRRFIKYFLVYPKAFDRVEQMEITFNSRTYMKTKKTRVP